MKDTSFYTGQKPPKKPNWWKRIFAGLVLIAGTVFGVHEMNQPITQTINPIDTVKNKIVLYGINGNLNHSPVNYSNAAFVDSLARLHPDIIRFPGGAVVDSFFWRTDSNKLVDFVPALKRIKCDGLFVLNMTTSTLVDQLEMLHTAQNLGAKIKYVELDNETNNINSAGRKYFKTAQAYADSCRVWVAGLRNDFDSLLIGIVGENKGYAPDVRNWMQVVDSIADYKVLHEYPNPNYFVTDGKVNYRLLDSVVLADLHETGFDLEAKFAVTECNLNLTDKNGRTAFIEPQEWTNALVHIAGLLKDRGAVVILFHNIVGDAGVWDVTKKTITPQPTRFALEEVLK